ncbi:histone methylase Hs17p [Cryptosporidium canis]|uniref:Protein arginine N-methyltransferase n=1 Tax=Cryptosporidium canis TaxID=195482 RepID=A0A9D5DJJ0_9CRYT|nr:histone methylase Hs17p [Cryptosporidium canis]
MPIRASPEIFNIGLDLCENDLKHYINNNEHLLTPISDSKQLKTVLSDIKSTGFDFVCVPIYQSDNGSATYLNNFSSKLKYVDHYEIKGNDWNSGIICKFPQFEDLSLNEFKLLLEWCEYVGYHAIVVSIGQLSVGLLSIISSFIGLVSTGIQIWIEIFIIDNSSIEKLWNEWQTVYTIINNMSMSERIGIVLKMNSKLCGSIREDNYLRFFGEPIKCISVNYDFFEPNNTGLASISKILTRFMRNKTPISIYFGNCDLNQKTQMVYTYNNITNFIKSFLPLSDQQRYEYNYIDLLQIPLQPLWTDLKSIEYEVFERDVVKYERYTSAIQLFLSENPNITEVRILIVGSGRGGLINSVFNAFENLGRNSFRILCVEKNKNAVLTLEAKIKYELSVNWKKVEVIHSDIRTIHLDDKFDLVISELMGSFGDNELSPECLMNAQKFIGPNGIMIPQRYTSYLEPVSCRKVWNHAHSYSKSNHLEMPFVSRLKSHYKMSKEGPKEVFSFNHPSEQLHKGDFTIFTSVEFTSNANSILHGFLGYFECKLYKEIGFSTIPCNFTNGLISWFDFFFPISQPIFLKELDTITFNIWRKSNKEKVWYEWLVTKPVASFIHNLNGKAYSIRL